MGDQLNFRQAKSQDIDDYLSLHRAVYNSDPNKINRKWFNWMYSSVSILDNIPVVLAESEDRIVGAFGYWGLQFQVSGKEFIGIKPVEVMIHPDYRGMNTFNRIAEAGREKIYPDNNWFEFGNPSDDTVEVWTRLQSWKIINKRQRKFRTQNPSFYLNRSSSIVRLPMRILDIPFRIYYLIKYRQINTNFSYEVSELHEPPGDTLEDLYKESIPDNKLHVIRDEDFYNSRLDAPHKEYKTYLAGHNSSSIAAIVVSKDENQNTVNIVEALPIGEKDDRSVQALQEILKTIVAKNRTATAIQWSPALPESFYSAFGFHISEYMESIATSDRIPFETSGLIPNNVIWGVRTSNIAQIPIDMLDYDNWYMSGIEQEI